MSLSFLKKYHNVASIQEFFHLLTWKELECLTAVLLFAYLVLPCWATFRMWIVYCGYILIQETVNYCCTVLGCLVLTLSMGKLITEKQISGKTLKDNRTYFYFCALAFWILLSSSVVGVTEDYLNAQRFEYPQTFMMYFFICFGCGTIISKPEIKRFLFRSLLISNALMGMISLVTYALHFDDPSCIFPSFIHMARYYLDSVFLNPNYYGYYLTMVTLISAGMYVLEKEKGWRIFYMIAFLMNCVMLVLLNTLGTYLSTLAGLVFLYIMLYIIEGKHHKIIWFMLGMDLLIAFILGFWVNSVFSDFWIMFREIGEVAKNGEGIEQAGTGRVTMWMHTLQYIKEKPLFGYGIDGIATRLSEEAGWSSRPHNEYLQYTVFHGIPAGILYLMSVLSIYFRGLRHKKELDAMTAVGLGASFAYLVSAFFGNTVFQTAPIFFVILGLSYHFSPENSLVSGKNSTN